MKSERDVNDSDAGGRCGQAVWCVRGCRMPYGLAAHAARTVEHLSSMSLCTSLPRWAVLCIVDQVVAYTSVHHRQV